MARREVGIGDTVKFYNVLFNGYGFPDRKYKVKKLLKDGKQALIENDDFSFEVDVKRLIKVR